MFRPRHGTPQPGLRTPIGIFAERTRKLWNVSQWGTDNVVKFVLHGSGVLTLRHSRCNIFKSGHALRSDISETQHLKSQKINLKPKPCRAPLNAYG